MRGFVFLLFLGVAFAQSWWEKYLLPAPLTIKGMVVDENGQPVGDVSIDHTNQREAPSTDANGIFAVETKVPAVVFRKQGFGSAFLRVSAKNDLKIVLRRAEKGFPVCGDSEKCTYLGDRGFCIPNVAGVRGPGHGGDIDYRTRSFTLSSRKKVAAVQGIGYMWSFGLPLDYDIWTSSEYFEMVYQNGAVRTIDGRGKTREGKLWRFLGQFGETFSYRDVEPADAVTLDKLFEGACMRPRFER